ncbi:MAG: IS110 family transposase [Eubacteriales bacterium]
MNYIGIDVAKDKHDCVILNQLGEVLQKPFTIPNTKEGFQKLLDITNSVSSEKTEFQVALEATGHYHLNVLSFLLCNNFTTFVLNPLHTNLYRKSQTLRKTKTDKTDAISIAKMLFSELDLQPYSSKQQQSEDLKSFTRYRFDKVQERAKLKQSISRLVTILFPELEQFFSKLHLASVYALLTTYPSAKSIAEADLAELTTVLYTASKGRIGKYRAGVLQEVARNSIGTHLHAKALELKNTIKKVQALDEEIGEIEKEIHNILEEIDSPIFSIPGVGESMGAMILAEIGDFSRFSSPDKILAFSGMSPTTYQSGQMYSTHAKMEKRGSRYLRYALYNATKFVCNWSPVFREYLAKKRAEGKHYNVALSHATKKLVRVIYQLQKSGETYKVAA